MQTTPAAKPSALTLDTADYAVTTPDATFPSCDEVLSLHRSYAAAQRSRKAHAKGRSPVALKLASAVRLSR